MQAEKLHSILFTKTKPQNNASCFDPAAFKDFYVGKVELPD